MVGDLLAAVKEQGLADATYILFTSDPDEIRNLARIKPDVVKDMDARLRKIVDCEAVDAKVKAYDKRSFRQWRAETKADGTYAKLMAQLFSGWDNLRDDEITPWTDKDEALILQWMGKA